MTPLQHAYLNKLQANALANLEFFKKNLPELHRLVIQGSPKATLDISDQGDLTIRHPDGRAEAVAPAMLAVEEHLTEFNDLETRPQLLAFHALRAVKEAPSHGDMQRYHYSNLDAEFPNRIRRHFVEHFPDQTGLQRYPVFGDKTIPLLIVLGSGVGLHLERLILDYEVRHLIVIDVDPDNFRLSTFFQDYVRLSRLAIQRETTLSFLIQPDIERVARNLMGLLRRNLPPFFVHGAALFYAIQDEATLGIIKGSIVDTLWQLFFGLGYFDDELISIRHTFVNLQRQLPVYTQAQCVKQDAIAFIIGSGPSLDGLLPLLTAYRDRAVLFSCGTALAALAHAGIQPDFHVEKERPHIVYEVLTRTVDRDFLKGIHFLGLNVVHPEVFPLFGDAGMVLKEADTTAFLLGQDDAIERIPLDTQPTVTNTALSIAVSLGFKRIYLVGVDLGFKDKSRHHSQHTAYLKQMPEAEHLRRLLSKPAFGDIAVPGNFGGEVATTKILDMARLHMESVIDIAPGARVFNLNDGAYIKGSISLGPEAFSCDSTPHARAEAIAAVNQAFSRREFDLGQLEQSLLQQVDAFIAQVKSLLAPMAHSKADVIDQITRLYLFTYSDALKASPVFPLFRGTVLHLASLAYNGLSIIGDDEEAAAKARYDLSCLGDCLDQARTEIIRALAADLPDITA